MLLFILSLLPDSSGNDSIHSVMVGTVVAYARVNGPLRQANRFVVLLFKF